MGTSDDTAGSGYRLLGFDSETPTALSHPSDPKGREGAKKAPLALIPVEAETQAAWAHAHGANKYGPWNWRETGVNAMTYAHAIRRHLAKWVDREDLDTESGLTHLAHIIASANILIDAAHHGKLIDDRPPKP